MPLPANPYGVNTKPSSTTAPVALAISIRRLFIVTRLFECGLNVMNVLEFREGDKEFGRSAFLGWFCFVLFCLTYNSRCACVGV